MRKKLERVPEAVDTSKVFSSETGKELKHSNQAWADEVKATGIRNPKLRKLLTNDVVVDPHNISDYDPEDHIPKIADPAVYETIIDLITEGNYVTTVANYAGIAPATFYNYLERGKNGYNKLYHQFYLDVQKAWAQAEVNTLKTLRDHEKADWRVSAWRLERTWPERYSLKTVNRTEINITGEVQHKIKNDFAESLIDDPEKRELARKLLSGTFE